MGWRASHRLEDRGIWFPGIPKGLGSGDQNSTIPNFFPDRFSIGASFVVEPRFPEISALGHEAGSCLPGRPGKRRNQRHRTSAWRIRKMELNSSAAPTFNQAIKHDVLDLDPDRERAEVRVGLGKRGSL